MKSYSAPFFRAVPLLAFLTIPSLAFPGQFKVSPVIIELDKSARSGSMAIMNDGQEKLNFQISASAWTQDVNGKDVYTETQDLVFYPKVMSVEPGEERIIRIGVKGPPPDREKTFRLFIQEIPSAQKAQESKASGKVDMSIRIVTRFVPPVFFKPAAPVSSGVVETINISKGVVKAVIRNTGNVHFKLMSVSFRGKTKEGREIFTREIPGWYVLNGVSRTYEASLAQDACKDLSSVAVEAKTDQFNLNGTLNVLKEMCLP